MYTSFKYDIFYGNMLTTKDSKNQKNKILLMYIIL
jgi:hypothetical protein